MAHSRHVNFDEDELAAHDLTRGSRTQIDQPDTPFLYYDSDGSEFAEMTKENGECERRKVNLNDLQEKLEIVSHLQESEQLYEDHKKEENENPEFVKKREAWMREQAEVLLQALSDGRSLDDGADNDCEEQDDDQRDDENCIELNNYLEYQSLDHSESDSCEEYDESGEPSSLTNSLGHVP